MPTPPTPEVRALLAVFVVVLASAALHMVARAFDRLEATDARARHAINAGQKLKEKIDELESQLEELQGEVEARR